MLSTQIQFLQEVLCVVSGFIACSLASRVLSMTPKSPVISVGIQIERSASISSDRNIGDHLWSWSTYFGRNIPSEIRRPFLENRFGKGIKTVRAIPIGWRGFIENVVSFSSGIPTGLRLTGPLGIMVSTLKLPQWHQSHLDGNVKRSILKIFMTTF